MTAAVSMPAVPRPASTVVLLRDGTTGIETLLMRRNARASFMPEAYVFPGGALDARDAAPEVLRHCGDLDDASVSRRLGMDRGGLSWLVAGLRECFEESGLLLARSQTGKLPAVADPVTRNEWRRRLMADTHTLAQLCEQHALQLACDELVFHSQWVTPPTRNKRFDTRFFLARAPQGQEASLVSDEMADLLWISLDAALQRASQGSLLLMTATRKTIEVIRPFANVAEALERTQSVSSVPVYRPAGSPK